MSIKLKKFVDIPENLTPGEDDLVLTWDFASNKAKVVPFSVLGEGGDYVTVDDLQDILQGYLRQPDLDDYLTETEIQALLTFATKEEAEAGILEDVFMSPARVKDAIEALAGADLDFATKQEAEDGDLEDVVMSPARTKDAIEHRAVQNGHSAMGFPDALNMVGTTPDGSLVVMSATEVSPQGELEEGTIFLAKSEPEYSVISILGESEATAQPEATMFFGEDGVNIYVQSGDVPATWDYGIYLAGLSIPDLDDPSKEDIIGMTPKLTKHLVDEAKHKIKTISGAYSLTGADDNTTIIAEGFGYTIDVAGLPDGSEVKIIPVGDVNCSDNITIDGGDLYPGNLGSNNKTIHHMEPAFVVSTGGTIYVTGTGSCGS